MNYKLILSDRALEHLEFWKKSGQKKILDKISKIFFELESHPYTGIGHPEALKRDLSEFWSRKIDKKNRIIYQVEDNF